MYNTGNKLVICQLQNAKLNFPKLCKVYARQNQKPNLIYLYIYLVEAFNSLALSFNSSFKNCFLEAFLVNVVNTKKCTTCS